MKFVTVLLCLGIFVWAAGESRAGEGGHYTPGVDFFENGSLPGKPGFYTKTYLINYSSDKLCDANGKKVGDTFKLNSSLLVNRLLYVTDLKLLGADWAVHAIIPLQYNKVTNPAGQKGDKGGLGDIMLEPLLLGWHGDQWDMLFSTGVYLPTGEWEREKVANVGKDFYTFMGSFGATWYFDEAKTWRAGGRLRYEKHTPNRTLDIHHGDDLTFEFSASKAFMQRVELGVAGYGQWQVTDDSGSDVFWDRAVRDRVWGAGPEIRLLLPEINGSITFNYIKEFAVVDRPQGQLFGLSLVLAY